MFKKDKSPTQRTLYIVSKLHDSDVQDIDGEKRYHLKKYNGNGRFSKLSDVNHVHLESLLRRFDIPFKTGNDAPRGGKLGDYIQIKKDDVLNLINAIFLHKAVTTA